MMDRATMDQVLRPTADPEWLLHADGYDPLLEAGIESRFAISNGFLGVRAARATTRGTRWIVPPRTYVAGLFDTPGDDASPPGLVPAADWLQVGIGLPGGPLVHHPGNVVSHRITLDMRRGALLSESRHLKSPAAASDQGAHVRTLRLVSLDERAIGLQLIQFEIEGAEVEMTFEASFGGVTLGLAVERLEQTLGVWRTHRSGKGIAIDPQLPSLWNSLAFSLQWRGRTVGFRIDQDRSRIEATLSTGDPMTLFVGGVPHDLRCDQTLSVSCITSVQLPATC